MHAATDIAGVGECVRVAALSARRPSLIGSAVGDNGIQRDVPGLWQESIDALRIVCEAEQERPPGNGMSLDERKGAVVVAAAHSESVAVHVEAEQRHDGEVEPARRDQSGPAPSWLGDAETVRMQCVGRPPAIEPQVARFEGVQYRQVTTLAHPRSP